MDRLYSCCDDKKVICWDAIALKQEKTFDGHKDKVPPLSAPRALRSFTAATAAPRVIAHRRWLYC